jgi:hypothetical protein
MWCLAVRRVSNRSRAGDRRSALIIYAASYGMPVGRVPIGSQ